MNNGSSQNNKSTYNIPWNIFVLLLSIGWLLYNLLSGKELIYYEFTEDYVIFVVGCLILSIRVVLSIIGWAKGEHRKQIEKDVENSLYYVSGTPTTGYTVRREDNTWFTTLFYIVLVCAVCYIFAPFFLIGISIIRLVRIIIEIVRINQSNKDGVPRETIKTKRNASPENKQNSNPYSINTENNPKDPSFNIITQDEVRQLRSNEGILFSFKFNDGKMRQCKKLGHVISDIDGGGKGCFVVVRALAKEPGISNIKPYVFMLGAKQETFATIMATEAERERAINILEESIYSKHNSFNLLSKDEGNKVINAREGDTISFKWADGFAHKSIIKSIIFIDQDYGDKIFYSIMTTDRVSGNPGPNSTVIMLNTGISHCYTVEYTKGEMLNAVQDSYDEMEKGKTADKILDDNYNGPLYFHDPKGNLTMEKVALVPMDKRVFAFLRVTACDYSNDLIGLTAIYEITSDGNVTIVTDQSTLDNLKKQIAEDA